MKLLLISKMQITLLLSFLTLDSVQDAFLLILQVEENILYNLF